MDYRQELSGILADIEDGIYRDLTQRELHTLLSWCAGRIDRLERENRDLKIDNEDLMKGGFLG
jgi:hypothetical protein